MTSGITVVVPAFNGADVVMRCLESLVGQTLAPERIVVVDDGSTDTTAEVVESARRRWPELITPLSQSNLGIDAAIMAGVSSATTEFVAVADQDDVSAPTRLEHSAALLQRTGADMVGGQVIGRLGERLWFAPSRFPTEPAGIADRIAAGLDPLPHTTMMVRRSGFERFGPYRPLRRAADLELMLRWAHRGARIVVSPEVFATYYFRTEFFSLDTQTRWMVLTHFARDVAPLADDEVPDFARWFARHRMWPARREAAVRVVRLTGRLGVGMLRARQPNRPRPGRRRPIAPAT